MTALGVSPAPVPSPGRAMRLLERLASLRLTLAILAALGLGVVVAYVSETRTVWALVGPLAACAVNLLAAIASNPVFRRQMPLLVFHLCLLALVLLVAAGRLTYLKGQVELTEGTWFEGRLTAAEAGPLHGGRLERVRFANLGFRIDYDAGLRRGPTRNAVRYLDAAGREQLQVIGDQTPLVLQGYRFYTSHNKGFAPTFRWRPGGGGEALTGSVHLPAYPLHEYRQAQTWQLPGSDIAVWTQLQFDENLLDPDRPDEFKLPAEHRLVLRVGEGRWELRPGDGVDLPEGRLDYQGVRAWMGYTVFYDWTIPWLLAAALGAVGALGWHFWRKFAGRPWNGTLEQNNVGSA